MKRMNVRRAREVRLGMTDAEQLLWYHLRGRRLSGWKFRRQHEIDRYIVDFVCADAGLIVELDGGQHAACRANGTGCVPHATTEKAWLSRAAILE